MRIISLLVALWLNAGRMLICSIWPSFGQHHAAARGDDGRSLLSYQKKLVAGELKPDAAQELLAEKLQRLHRSLIGYRPRTGQVGWREWLGFAAPRGAPLRGFTSMAA